MAVPIVGTTGNFAKVGRDGNVQVSLRSPDMGTMGAYSGQFSSGTITAFAAGSTLFSCRWGSSTGVAIVERIAVAAFTNGTITTSVPVNFAAYVARSFTIADTGGTDVTPSVNTYKRRTSMPTSQMSSMRKATTATLTPGTRTLDAQPFSMPAFGLSGTTTPVVWFAGNQPIVIYDAVGTGGRHPIVLAQNEGVVITNVQAGPADGTWVGTVLFEWSEVFEY